VTLGVKVDGVWGPQRGPGQSPSGGLGAKPPEAEKHVINFALRIMLLNSYLPYINTFVIGFSSISHISDFQSFSLPIFFLPLLSHFSPLEVGPLNTASGREIAVSYSSAVWVGASVEIEFGAL